MEDSVLVKSKRGDGTPEPIHAEIETLVQGGDYLCAHWKEEKSLFMITSCFSFYRLNPLNLFSLCILSFSVYFYIINCRCTILVNIISTFLACLRR